MITFVTWNCQGAFRKKAHLLTPLQPTLAVVQECECPTKLRWPADTPPPDDFLWQGDNLDKGVGVFSYGNLRLALDDRYDPTIRHCVPVRVSGDLDIHLLAVWAMGHRQKARSYVGQVYAAVHHYADFIRERPTVILGDLNSNAIWDAERKVSNHSAVVRDLAAAGLVSVYHESTGEAHGREEQQTFFLHRAAHKGYHLDYCFVPRIWWPNLANVYVGPFDPWCSHSDHMPLAVEFHTLPC
jgi:endonuclease/exonuclease/phosphatase family metal-dependent hydrolase